ncbi:MAG: hypothetical protein KTR31_05020 [Myxococcales bacterium]|nr:hypothetical protein [Myxococcales bacterium]
MTQTATVDITESDSAWDALLAAVHAAHPGIKVPVPLSVFATQVGGSYDGELMVIGRAINGWPPDVSLDDLAEPESRRRVVATARATDDDEPLAFVHREWRRRSGRSAFWRMAWRVCEALQIGGSDDWAHHLAWSHLYRVAGQRSGNPSAPLSRVQRGACTELLRADLHRLRPRRVLFLTGASWAEPFLESLGPSLGPRRDVGVHAAGSWDGRAVVLADHPQCRPEEPMAEAITDAFRELAVSLSPG